MKHYLLYLCIAMLFASCRKANEPSQGGDQMSFAAQLGGKEDDWGSAASTRGAVTDNSNINQFAAFCYHTDLRSWDDVKASALPNRMFDRLVTRNGDDWVYDPRVEWLGGDGSYFTFFGYSPQAAGAYQGPDNSQGNNIELASADTDAGAPVIRYETMDDVSRQVDLLVATPIYNTRPVEKVQMKFSHALSQIRFKAWSQQRFVTVNSITIKDAKCSATLALDGTAPTLEANTKTFVLDNIDKSLSMDQSNMTDLSEGSDAFLLLPQDFASNSTAEIIVKYTSGNDATGTEQRTSAQYLLGANNQTWEANKSYTYTLELTGKPFADLVISDVTITDWMVDSEDNMSTIEPSNPINPPSANDYIEIDGLKWTKGNLVASSSTAGKTNGCKVGAPTDGGLYFQFGSLIGWKGGAEANGGTGVGANPNTGAGSKWWGGAGSWSWDNDAMVWPTKMTSTLTAWSTNVQQATEANAFKKGYFDFSGTSQVGSINYATAQSDIRSYTHPDLGALKEGKMAPLGIGDPCAYYLGDPWRLPTPAEFKAVFDNAENGTVWTSVPSWDWITSPYNGAQRTGNTLYFPASGRRYHSHGAFEYVATDGYCWSSSVSSATSGYYLSFGSGDVYPQNTYSRSNGFPVRCVSGTYVAPPPSPDYTATPANSYVTYPKTAGGAMQAVKFNALKKPIAKYAQGNTSAVNTVGSNPSTADGGLENDITYQEGDVIEVTWQTAVNHANSGSMVIKSIAFGADGIATVEVNGAGNAVLSYKRGGVILWNYHIWATDSYPFATHAATGGDVNGTTPNGQARFMDRNLGALEATAAKPATADAYKYFGVLYQHGRPTPFTGQGAGETADTDTKIFDGSGAEITSTIGGYTQSNTAVSSVTEAIQAPNTYYYFRDATTGNSWTWYKFADISLWSDYGTNKSIYDPCPYGYRVPINGSWSSWGSSHSQTWTSGDINGGVVNNSWWPAAGRRNGNSGTIGVVGYYGWYWSSSRHSNAYLSYYLEFGYNGSINPSNYYYRSNGVSVRCVEEGY